jgi:hypothetical protein
MTSTIPPLVFVAVGLLVVAQIVGIVGLRAKLNLTASLAVVLLLGGAAVCGVMGGLQVLPGH